MMQYGFKNFAEDVLNTVQKPLSIMEIWEEGIIEIPEESEILFRSKLKQHLDINMLDKLILKNKDFASLFHWVLESQSLEKIVDKEKIFDPVLDDNAYQKYLKDKKLRLWNIFAPFIFRISLPSSVRIFYPHELAGAASISLVNNFL